MKEFNHSTTNRNIKKMDASSRIMKEFNHSPSSLAVWTLRDSESLSV